jgi:hypothetical protein
MASVTRVLADSAVTTAKIAAAAVTSAKLAAGVVGAGGTLVVRDEKADGTDGGTFTSGAMRTRTLNTVATNTISGASLASNQITLPAGTYYIDADAPAYKVDFHLAKLRNVTDSTDTIIGAHAVSGSGDFVTSLSVVRGVFTIAASKAFEIQHQCSTTSSFVGFGEASSFAGYVEVYTQVTIFKLS